MANRSEPSYTPPPQRTEDRDTEINFLGKEEFFQYILTVCKY
jgi:hypothetical protein